MLSTALLEPQAFTLPNKSASATPSIPRQLQSPSNTTTELKGTINIQTKPWDISKIEADDCCDQMEEMDEGADRAVQSIRGQGPGTPVKVTMMTQNDALVFKQRQASSSFSVTGPTSPISVEALGMQRNL